MLGSYVLSDAPATLNDPVWMNFTLVGALERPSCIPAALHHYCLHLSSDLALGVRLGTSRGTVTKHMHHGRRGQHAAFQFFLLVELCAPSCEERNWRCGLSGPHCSGRLGAQIWAIFV